MKEARRRPIEVRVAADSWKFQADAKKAYHNRGKYRENIDKDPKKARKKRQKNINKMRVQNVVVTLVGTPSVPLERAFLIVHSVHLSRLPTGGHCIVPHPPAHMYIFFCFVLFCLEYREIKKLRIRVILLSF